MVTAAWLLVLQLTTPAGDAAWRAGCDDRQLRQLDAIAAAVLTGANRFPDDVGESAARQPTRCGLAALAELAERGWREARRLAPRGGDTKLLGPVNKAIEELDSLKPGPLALEAEYAEVAVRAAISAAQDERPEMALFLTHARDLSERLVQRGRRASWPRPFNLLAAELWLEVDRYDEARQAYERAASADPSPLALVGLAESLARLNRRDDACHTVRRVKGAEGQVLDTARRLLATCR
jgi:tetratricopeptide (TPR) repeat protein